MGILHGNSLFKVIGPGSHSYTIRQEEFIHSPSQTMPTWPAGISHLVLVCPQCCACYLLHLWFFRSCPKVYWQDIELHSRHLDSGACVDSLGEHRLQGYRVSSCLKLAAQVSLPRRHPRLPRRLRRQRQGLPLARHRRRGGPDRDAV